MNVTYASTATTNWRCRKKNCRNCTSSASATARRLSPGRSSDAAMTTTLSFSFQHRPLVPFAHERPRRPGMHQHDCALSYILAAWSGSRRSDSGWCRQARRPEQRVDRQRGGAHPVYRSAGWRAVCPLYLPDRSRCCGKCPSLALAERYAPASRDERIYTDARFAARMEPQSERGRLCQQVNDGAAARQAGGMSERTAEPPFFSSRPARRGANGCAGRTNGS